jgi:hypothetical protein
MDKPDVSERWPKVTLFIKLRKENEYITDHLSEVPVDYQVKITIDTACFIDSSFWLYNVAVYEILDNHGDTLYKNYSSFNDVDGSFFIYLGDELTLPVSPFFWQIEFYNKNSSIDRLPDIPGLWFFGLNPIE